MSVTKMLSATTSAMGSMAAIIGSVALIVGWLLTGPLFDYSDTWQLIINTSTTIITFLMVFVIQNTQNRDGRAIQTKLDALIKATDGADDALIALEEESEDRIKDRQQELRD